MDHIIDVDHTNYLRHRIETSQLAHYYYYYYFFFKGRRRWLWDIEGGLNLSWGP